MHNIKLTLAYDGTDFSGWQIQAGRPTVQGALTDVIRKLTQENLTIHAAGRTDAGVHALGQVAHFKTRSELTAAQFLRALTPCCRQRSACSRRKKSDPTFTRVGRRCPRSIITASFAAASCR